MNPAPAPENPRSQMLALVLRVGLFVLLGWIGLLLFPMVLLPIGGLWVAAAMSVFAAAVVANAISVRIFERGRLADCGLGWTAHSLVEFAKGAGSGMAGASLVILVPLALQQAHFVKTNDSEHPWASFVFVSLTLLFGAVGEEMMFHGYAFQLLVRRIGAFSTIVPAGVLFGIVHLGNQGVNALGVANTMAWGILLGFAYVRTQALWLPIGLHFGWNFALPLLGANLSGFTMGVTGYELEWTGSALWSGGAYGPEGGILTTAAVVLLAVALPRFVPDASEISDQAGEVS